MDAAATMASVAVIGMALYRPESRPRSRVPVSWSTMPAAMKSEALKVAWLTMWKMAATSARLCVQAQQQRDQAQVADGGIGQHALHVLLEDGGVGAQHQRDQPRPPMIQNQASVPASTGQNLASRNTPAFTMVAECR